MLLTEGRTVYFMLAWHVSVCGNGWPTHLLKHERRLSGKGHYPATKLSSCCLRWPVPFDTQRDAKEIRPRTLNTERRRSILNACSKASGHPLVRLYATLALSLIEPNAITLLSSGDLYAGMHASHAEYLSAQLQPVRSTRRLATTLLTRANTTLSQRGSITLLPCF